MAGIKHAFASGKADDADATLVNPSDWNDEHEPNLTTKGDIIAQEATNAVRLPVGSNGELLTAASGEASGLKYALCPTLDLVTTAGDILQATGADALARLAIGSAGGILQVNAGATALGYLALGSAREILAVNSGATAVEYTKRKRTYVWFVPGTVAVGTEQGPTFRIDEACTILDVRLHVKTAPTDADLIVDINDGGSTVFSTKPEIDASGTVEDDNHSFSDTALADNTELTMDVDQVGSTVAGEDLTVEIEVSVP